MDSVLLLNSIRYKKSRIRETPTLSTDADSSTDDFFLRLQKKRKKKKKRGGWGDGLTNEMPGIDHVSSGPMRGLKKTAPNSSDTQTHRHPEKRTWRLYDQLGPEGIFPLIVDTK